MTNIEITFGYTRPPDESTVSQAVYGLLGSWLRSGQLADADWNVTFTEEQCLAVVSCPEATSLSMRRANKWVRQSIRELGGAGLGKPSTRILGRALESEVPDRCKKPQWYVLITNYLSCESPLYCGDHYRPVPLYRIPYTYDADPSYWDILCWQRQWKDMDSLQMACGAGERFATQQIASVRSKLAQEGRSLCSRIEALSGVPTYYYLYRGSGRSLASERKRRCPSCEREWLLAKPIHLFDFRCDHCRLVSNIAFSCK